MSDTEREKYQHEQVTQYPLAEVISKILNKRVKELEGTKLTFLQKLSARSKLNKLIQLMEKTPAAKVAAVLKEGIKCVDQQAQSSINQALMHYPALQTEHSSLLRVS